MAALVPVPAMSAVMSTLELLLQQILASQAVMLELLLLALGTVRGRAA